MKLTNIICKQSKSKDKPYRLFDGGGLYLEIMPTGSKIWRLKYRFNNKEKRLSFGAYPLISLVEARHERDKAKRLLLKMIDPMDVKKGKKQEIIRNSNTTVKAVALCILCLLAHYTFIIRYSCIHTILCKILYKESIFLLLCYVF